MTTSGTGELPSVTAFIRFTFAGGDVPSASTSPQNEAEVEVV